MSLKDMKTTKWSITHWLTEGRTLESLQQLVQNMPNDWAIEGQIEQGKIDDKLHGQLFLKTPQTRGTRIAKFFPHSHIEEARNKFALQNYVHKEETRVGEFKTVENRSPQWSVVCDKFYDWLIIKTDYASQIRQDDEKLALWDEFIGLSIEEGMRVDIIGVNPQYRSCIMRYWTNYIKLAYSRQTSIDKIDRQTECSPAEGGGASGVKKTRNITSVF